MAGFDYVLTVITQVTVISLFCLLLTALQPHRPARRHAFGFLGLCLILGSPMFAALLPVMPWWRWAAPDTSSHVAQHEELPRRPIAPADVRFERPMIKPADEIVPTPPNIPDNNAAAAPVVAAAPLTPPITTIEVAAGDWSWTERGFWLVGGVWLMGSILSAALWLRQRLRLRWLTRTLLRTESLAPLSEQDERFAEIATAVCGAVGLQELPPIAVADLPMPFVLGVWRPTIILPRELLQPGCVTQLRDVLIHEAAHVARMDAWISVAQRWMSTIWWWHPGVLVLNQSLSRAREEVCDNFVLRGGDAAQYAETLVDLAEKCADWGRAVPALGILGFGWSLESRIHGLLKPGRDT